MDITVFIALALFLLLVVCWFVLPGTTATGVIDHDTAAEPLPLASAQQNV